LIHFYKRSEKDIDKDKYIKTCLSKPADYHFEEKEILKREGKYLEIGGNICLEP
jgi:hypothetical protein